MEQAKSNFSILIDDAKLLVEKKTDLFLLNATEKASKLTSTLIWGALLAVVSVFTLLFGSTALAWWIGDLMGNIPLGFCILTGFYFVLFLALFWFAKNTIKDGISSVVIKSILNDDDN